MIFNRSVYLGLFIFFIYKMKVIGFLLFSNIKETILNR